MNPPPASGMSWVQSDGRSAGCGTGVCSVPSGSSASGIFASPSPDPPGVSIQRVCNGCRRLGLAASAHRYVGVPGSGSQARPAGHHTPAITEQRNLSFLVLGILTYTPHTDKHMKHMTQRAADRCHVYVALRGSAQDRLAGWHPTTALLFGTTFPTGRLGSCSLGRTPETARRGTLLLLLLRIHLAAIGAPIA